MRKKQVKQIAKPLKDKKQTKNANQQKKELKPKNKKKVPEIVSENLQLNKSNKSLSKEIEELSKRSEKPKEVKSFEIMSDEETTYLINFEQVKDKLRIKAIEKNTFPQNEFENFYSLEDLIKIDKWFKIFYNIENLLIEF